MKTTTQKMKNLRRRRGQGMTEYIIIIVGLIAILLVTAITNFKGALETTFDKSTNSIKTNVSDKIK